MGCYQSSVMENEEEEGAAPKLSTNIQYVRIENIIDPNIISYTLRNAIHVHELKGRLDLLARILYNNGHACFCLGKHEECTIQESLDRERSRGRFGIYGKIRAKRDEGKRDEERSEGKMSKNYMDFDEALKFCDRGSFLVYYFIGQDPFVKILKEIYHEQMEPYRKAYNEMINSV